MFRKTGGRVSSAPEPKRLTPTELEEVLEGLGFEEIRDEDFLEELEEEYTESVESVRYSCESSKKIRAVPVNYLTFRLVDRGKSWEEAYEMLSDFWETRLMRGKSCFLTLPKHVYLEVRNGGYAVYMGNGVALKGPLEPWEKVEKELLRKRTE